MPVVAGHEVRPLRVEDAGPAAAVHRALQESLGYRPSATCTELQEWWRRCDLESDSWALEEGGALLGLAWVTVDEGIARASGFVAPSAAGRGLGRALVNLAE
ncbi:MAG TPA: GNAT family N-acetyltransferase, partial [Gaiellaceae bacterium]|nr:GNAT family N-acetyltransferase [Gaiellaceae bacterium]